MQLFEESPVGVARRSFNPVLGPRPWILATAHCLFSILMQMLVFFCLAGTPCIPVVRMQTFVFGTALELNPEALYSLQGRVEGMSLPRKLYL